jgi:glycosyltransferase involved in cell wall biosynthesis
MPRISIVIPTNRIGGLDVLAHGLSNQTYHDFELVLSDGIYDYRSKIFEDRKLNFPVIHVPPIDNPFPVAGFCRYSNTGLVHASGELVLFVTDYTWLPPDLIKKHVDFHDLYPNSFLMCPHQYVMLPSLNAEFKTYGHGDINRYAVEVGSYSQDIMWSIFDKPFDQDPRQMLIDPMKPLGNRDPKLDHPGGLIETSFFHGKNESCKLDAVLSINGWDEDLDGTHFYQDSDLADRLSVKTGLKCVCDPTNVAYIVNPRHIFPFPRKLRSFKTNEYIWRGKKADGYANGVNFWKLSEKRSEIHGLKNNGDTGNLILKNDILYAEGRNYKIASKKKLKIAFLYGPWAIGDRKIDIANIWGSSRGLTGSELSFFSFAREMFRRGHDINIFLHGAEKQLWEGIQVYPHNQFEKEINSSFDAAYTWMEPDPLKFVPDSVLRILNQQVNDFDYCQPGFDKFVDVYTSPSQSHLDWVRQFTPIPTKWEVMPNGCDPSQYTEGYRVPGRIIWASSPDRGLHLLLQAWPNIKKVVPEAHLKIFYDMDGWLKKFSNMPVVDHSVMGEWACRAGYIEFALNHILVSGFDIEKCGSVSRIRMIKEMNEAMVLAYPCDTMKYTEGFSVTTMEACAAGIVPIISSVDSLGQIYGGAVPMVQAKACDHLPEFTELVIKALKDSDFREKVIVKTRVLAAQHAWPILAEKFEKLIFSKLKV